MLLLLPLLCGWVLPPLPLLLRLLLLLLLLWLWGALCRCCWCCCWSGVEGAQCCQGLGDVMGPVGTQAGRTKGRHCWLDEW